MKRFIIVILAVSILVAGFVSWFASTHLDGLERVAENKGFIEKAKEPSHKLFPDYTIPGINTFWSNVLAGIIGTLASFCLVMLLGKFINRKIKKGGTGAPHSH